MEAIGTETGTVGEAIEIGIGTGTEIETVTVSVTETAERIDTDEVTTTTIAGGASDVTTALLGDTEADRGIAALAEVLPPTQANAWPA